MADRSSDLERLLDLRDAVRAWHATEPESVKYPSPSDYSELERMEEALEATKGIRRPK